MALPAIESNWRAPDTYAAIAQGGRSALAWEVLRRSRDYRAAFAGQCQSVDISNPADAGFLARWGLHFR